MLQIAYNEKLVCKIKRVLKGRNFRIGLPIGRYI